MLIIPVLTKPSRKSIPWVCLGLIIVNTIIFIAVSIHDKNNYDTAYIFYKDSGLLQIELDAYREYLKSSGTPISSAPSYDLYLLQKMQLDDRFLSLLRDNAIIGPGHSQFTDWRSKRDQFEALLEKRINYRYGYSPKKNNYLALITSLFLHGGIFHLVGNMVFLWLIGALLEKVLGSLFFIKLYIVTGICACLMFGFVYPDKLGPLVGASGAISGLMGAYCVLFGLRKIKVFYSIGFYFNYTNLPALLLFPVWLLSEIIQLSMNQYSNVAYMAHIGGLLSGLLLGSILRYFLKERIDKLFAVEDQKVKLETLLDKAMNRLEKLDLTAARRLFKQIVSISPGNVDAVRQIYEIDKTNPSASQFHTSAHNLLHTIGPDRKDEYLRIFEEYQRLSEKPKLTLEIVERLVQYYLDADKLEEAAKFISSMIKSWPNHSNVPRHLLSLSRKFEQTGKRQNGIRCHQILAKKYPHTDEGIASRNFLTSIRIKNQSAGVPGK